MRQPWPVWPGHHLAIAALVALAAAEWTRVPASQPVPTPVAREAAGESPGRMEPGVSLALVDQALDRRDLKAALGAWHVAHEAALRAEGWEALIDVGDAWLRIGDLGGDDAAPYGRAREVYLAAMFRARRQGSLEGVLRVAEIFGALGDEDLATQCARIAERMAGQDPESRADLRAFTTRLANGPAR
jgi:hypothetical protein